MNLAKGVINTFVETGIRTDAGWMVSLPQCPLACGYDADLFTWLLVNSNQFAPQ